MGWMWTNATNAWAKQKYSPLPTTTDDSYLNYYIGFDNGAWAADAENQHSTIYYHGNCGVGHTDEYCTGFKAGWNYEANALGPPPSTAHTTNESCPPGMYADFTDGILTCTDAHGTHELVTANMTNQWHRAWSNI